ncbi:MAG: arabinose ABC transporter substrate-binding protein [Opitutaceae bacterium]|nr:arabinose ABC transporter substrate-binding protein [Opitutaceae bacterium]
MKLPAGFRPLQLFGCLILLLGGGGCTKTPDTAAAGKAGGTSQPIKIGFLVKQPEEPWFQLEWKFAEKAAADLKFNLVKIGATDGEKVLAAIDNLAAGGAQGFVICTPDTKLGPAIVAKAKAANLKLIAVDDQFIGADGQPMKNVHYLGISARKIGESVGQTLAAEMKKRGWKAAETAVCMVTFDELATAKERTDGASDALVAAGFPREKIFRAPVRTTDIPGSFEASNTLLTQKPDVKRWLVGGMNDTAVLGAVRALEGRGVPVENAIAVGINGTDCIVELEKAKPTSFYGSMLLSAKEHGYKTCEMLRQWIKDGVEPPLDTRTVGTLITRENFRQVLKEQGVRD